MKLLILACVLLLTGCANIGAVKERGAQVSDNAIQSSVDLICEIASIGSVRRYFNTPEKVKTWKELCQGSDFEL